MAGGGLVSDLLSKCGDLCGGGGGGGLVSGLLSKCAPHRCAPHYCASLHSVCLTVCPSSRAPATATVRDCFAQVLLLLVFVALLSSRLQAVQYAFIAEDLDSPLCDNWVNKVLTLAGFLHICLQPYFCHVIST